MKRTALVFLVLHTVAHCLHCALGVFCDTSAEICFRSPLNNDDDAADAACRLPPNANAYLA